MSCRYSTRSGASVASFFPGRSPRGCADERSFFQMRFRLHGPGTDRLDRAGLADGSGLSTPNSSQSVPKGAAELCPKDSPIACLRTLCDGNTPERGVFSRSVPTTSGVLDGQKWSIKILPQPWRGFAGARDCRKTHVAAEQPNFVGGVILCECAKPTFQRWTLPYPSHAWRRRNGHCL